MKPPRYALWAALVALAVGASLLHFRIHPPKSLTYFWPNLMSWLDLVLVSVLFLFRSTAILGLLLNSFLAYLGIIMMADFSIEATMTGFIKVMPWESFGGWLLQTTFPDIMILAADFLVGVALYRAILMDSGRG